MDPREVTRKTTGVDPTGSGWVLVTESDAIDEKLCKEHSRDAADRLGIFPKSDSTADS